MKKNILLIVIIVSVQASGALGWLFLLSGDKDDSSVPVTAADQDYGLGITYLTITPELSQYYGLGVEHGSLITEVNPSSAAARAGLQKGDVILKFNGTPSKETTPLLGMMMACPTGHMPTVEVWRDAEIKTFQLVHEVR